MTMDVQRVGRRLNEFLGDPDVQKVLAAYKEGAYKAFLTAKTDEERRNAQAEAMVLDKFEGVLQGIVEEGRWKDTQETTK